MYVNTYGGSAAELAVALVNIDDYTPTTLTVVLVQHDIRRPQLSAAMAGGLRSWASLLGAVFGETSQDRQVALVNGLLAQAASRPSVSTHDGQAPHLHYTSERADVVSRVRAVTAGGLAVALCYGGGDRLGRCNASGCAIVFVDTSRNGQRRYCSVRCANRVNVAIHRGRQGR